MGRRQSEVEGLVITSGFWHRRRVLLTGHTGFKGSWLALVLARLNADVTGLALDPAAGPQLYGLARVADGLRDLRADVTDPGSVSRAVEAADPEIIIHMAAQPLVSEGYRAPASTFLTNVMGTVHVLDAARRAPNLRAALMVTTDKCYENVEAYGGYRETDRLGGSDPYSNSKACAEQVTACYRASYFADAARPVAILSARAGNVIGGGDFAVDRIVPDAVRALIAGEPLHVRHPGAVRPWQHVLDPLLAYLELLERAAAEPSAYGTAWNIGPGAASERPVAALLSGLAAAWGCDDTWLQDERRHPKETACLRLDTTQAQERLGWTPLLGFDEMIDWTATWYRTYVDGGDVAVMTMEQVDRALTQRLRLTVPSVAPASRDRPGAAVDRAARRA